MCRAYWLRLWCWGNNVANSHLNLGPFNSRVLHSCLVLQYSNTPHWFWHQWRLVNWLDDCVLHQQTIFLSSWSSKMLCFITKEPRSVACRTMEHGHLVHSALTRSAVGTYGIVNQDTHLYPLHNNSSVHLMTTTEVRCFGRITDGMQSGWRVLRDSVSSLTSTPTLLEWPYQEQGRPDLTISMPVWDVFAPAYTNVVRPLLGLWV